MNGQGHLLEGPGKIQIGRRIEYRIAAQHDQSLDLPGRHGRGQLLDGLLVGHRLGLHRLGGKHRFADDIQGIVHGQGQGMHHRRLLLARHDQTGAAVPLQVAHHRFNPRLKAGRVARRGVHPEPARQRPRHVLHLAGPHHQAMVGGGPGQGGRALHRIQAVHLGRALHHIAAGHKVAGITNPSRAPPEEVPIQAQHHARLGEVVAQAHRLTHGQLRAQQAVIVVQRLVLVPARFREPLQHLGHQLGQAGRGHGFSQDAQPGPAPQLQRHKRGLHFLGKGVPGGDPAAVHKHLRAVRVIEVQDGGLGKDIGSPQAGRMPRVALYFGGPPLMALGQHAQTVARVGRRRGVEQGLARNHFLGRDHVGNYFFHRLLGAGGQPGQGHGSAHEADEIAAVDGIPLRHRGGMARHLPLHHAGEPIGAGQVLQAAPVGAPAGLGQLGARLRQGKLGAGNCVGKRVVHRWHRLQFSMR